MFAGITIFQLPQNGHLTSYHYHLSSEPREYDEKDPTDISRDDTDNESQDVTFSNDDETPANEARTTRIRGQPMEFTHDTFGQP